MARSGNLKTSYELDMAIFQTRAQRIWLFILFCALLTYPLVVGTYYVNILNLAMVSVVGATGLSILTAFTGQISLGHAAFVAVGAYASAILSTNFNMPFWLAIILAGFVAVAIGILVGLPSLRLEGLYLAIATMACYFIIAYIISHWYSLTGGPWGMKTQAPHIGSFYLDTQVRLYYMLLFATVIAVAVALNLVRSKFGRAFMAIRDRDIAAAATGIDVVKYKLLSFALSSFYAGVAGGLYAYVVGTVTPEHFSFTISIQYLAMIISGGMGSIIGAVFGGLFITLLPEGLRLLMGPLSAIWPNWSSNFLVLKEAMYGLVIMLFLLGEPAGLFGIWNDLRKWWTVYPYKYE